MFYKAQVISLVFITFLASFASASDTGQLYTGLYPDDFWRNTEILNSVASWAGKPMTFGGTFLDASEDSSNIVEKLEQAWQGQSTPFANVEMSGSALEVAYCLVRFGQFQPTGEVTLELTYLILNAQGQLEVDPEYSDAGASIFYRESQ